MRSAATTVKQYLAELPEDRRNAITAVRQTILDNLPAGYEEGMQYGMISYFVPHSVYPAGYHCDPRQPLPFTCLASQKNYMSLYSMVVYGDAPLAEWFQAAWSRTGKKLDMGKSCIRFRKLEDLPLDVIGEAIRRVPVKTFIEYYETMTASARTAPAKPAKKAKPAAGDARPQTKTSARKPASKKPAAKKASSSRARKS